MNLKFRALSYTTGIFACVTIGALALVEILKMLPQEWVPTIFASFLVALIFKFVYEIVKINLEYKEKLAEIAKK